MGVACKPVIVIAPPNVRYVRRLQNETRAATPAIQFRVGAGS
jgi:hypothetical protein